ncbi:MAG: hypothetical protein SVV03_00155 [Candidatus Nanohaloarchaea archaeon]|nr:hypothetical protein [Candidatus Nanohaloarchaea archaeon]
MVSLKIQPAVKEFVIEEYGEQGLKVLNKAVEKMDSMMRWKDSPSEVSKMMDGSFQVKGANILKKYVNGSQQAWRMAIKRISEEVYAVEMFASKKDEDLLLRKLQKKF